MQDIASKLAAKEKDTTDAGLKRSRSSSLAAATGAQRVPLGPGRAVTSNGTVLAPVRSTILSRFQKSSASARPQQRIPVSQDEVVPVEDEDEWDDMEVEQPPQSEPAEEDEAESSSYEIEAMVDARAEPEPEVDDEPSEPKPLRVWPELATARANRYRQEIEEIRENFQEELDDEDTTMVSEYADEIFKYMCELEVRCVLLV